MYQDKDFAWLRKRRFYNVLELNGLITETVASQTEGQLLSSAFSGTWDMSEVGTSGLVGAGSAVNGDDIRGFIRIPYDLDPKFPVGIKIFCTADITSTGTITYSFTWQVKKLGEDLSSLSFAALNTVLTGVTFTADSILGVSNRGVINLLNITRTNIEDGALLTFNLDQALAGTVVDGILLGVEFDYVPQLCSGEGNLMDRALASGLGGL